MRTRGERRLRGVLTAALALLAAAPLQGQSRPRAERPLVVIDAGHGGVDPGARGPRGTREKTVALAVARELAAILRETADFEVRMTRDRDSLVALRDRPRMANRWRAAGGKGDRPALFLSIHCNANGDASARGFETYFLAEAKTADARRVEAMENAAEEYEEKRPAARDDLGFIMADLRQNHYLRASSSWAELIQGRLAGVHTGPDRGVKQAGFLVLNGAFMPAVLVEIGFITNPREEALLTDPAFQRGVARQLARAVVDFLDTRAQTDGE